MSSKWIRKGDKVAVIAGNEKGQVAKVLVMGKNRVILEGLNIRKKHVKPKQKMQPGIVEMEAPIHISNVSLCDDEGKPIKVQCKILKDGKKQLVYKNQGKEVIFREVKTKKN